MAEVPQHPPQPSGKGKARVIIDNDLGRASRGTRVNAHLVELLCKRIPIGQRMTPAVSLNRAGKIPIEIEIVSARNMA